MERAVVTRGRLVVAMAATLSWWPANAGAESIAPASEAPEEGEDGVGEDVEEFDSDLDVEDYDDSPEAIEARRLFRRGLELARAGDCERAVVDLRASLEARRRPETLYNMAQCQERLGRLDLALAAYREFLDESDEGDPDRAAAEATVALLRRRLATLVVRANVPCEVWVDGQRMGDAPGDVPVPSGSHRVELRADGYVAAQRDVELSGGRRYELDFVLQPVDAQRGEDGSDHDRLHPAYFWLSVASALASAAVATGLGSWALSMREDVLETDPRTRSFEQLDRIERVALVTDVFWGIAGAFAVTAIILGVLTDWGDRGAATARRPRLQLGLATIAVLLGG